MSTIETKTEPQGSGHKFSPMVGFIIVMVTAIAAGALLLTAFIIWFAEVVGSLTLSLLLTSVANLLICITIYSTHLAPQVARINRTLEMVEQTVEIINSSYSWALAHIRLILQLLK